MNALRTADDRFVNLPGYPFEPNYIDLDGLRMHYVAAGPANGETVLLLHGEPSWSYLYRKMIPVFSAAGLRAVAPDLFGFGRSDKPTQRSDYSYQAHVGWLTRFIEALDLHALTLVGQDWGWLDRPARRRRAPGPLRAHRRRQHLPAHRRSAAG